MEDSIIELNEKIKQIKKKRIETMGSRLKDLRKEHGYSQAELSDFLGAERTAVTNIEAGKQNVTVESLLAICEIFKITPNDFLSGLYKSV